MRLGHILAMVPLALGTAYGCLEAEDVTGEESHALNIDDLTVEPEILRVSPQASILNLDVFDKSEILSRRFHNLMPAPRPEIENAALKHYDIAGSNCEEAKADMESKGFTIDGQWRAGKTETQLGFNCGYAPAPGESDAEHRKFCCSAAIDELTAYCNATVYLPQWDGISRCWDRFIDGLTTHEQGHVDICQDYAGRLNDAIIGLTSSVCSTESMAKACEDAVADLEQKANDAYSPVSEAHEAAQDAYDTGNNHGETQGARLNCDCE